MNSTKCTFIILFLVSIYFDQNIAAQGTGYCTIRGKQFYDGNGDAFFPLVCNYKANIFYNVNDPMKTEILSAEHHYGASDDWECTDQPSCNLQITNDFLEIKNNLHFNTVRMAWISGSYDALTNSINYIVWAKDWSDSKYISINYPYDYSSNQLAFDKIFSFYDGVHQAALAADIKVIWLINGNGVESDLANSASASVDQVIAFHCRNFVNTLAYDLVNEPSTYDIATKQWCCSAVANMYDAIKDSQNGDPNHLVTIGGFGPNGVFFFDVNILKVDFFSIHTYIPTDFSNSITYTVDDKINMANGYFYWLGQISNKPFIVGETGFRADDFPFPNEIVDGSILDQSHYAEKTLNLCVKCGYSGYSWWVYQDEFNFHSGYGLLYAGLPFNEKPICINIRNFDITQVNGNCLPPDNYNTDIGPLLIPINSNTIHGTVKVDGHQIKNAVIEGFNTRYLSNNNPRPAEQIVFTNDNGEFTISPIPNDLGSTSPEPQFENLKVTAPSSNVIIKGIWSGSQIMDNDIYELNGINFNYDETIDGISSPQQQDFKAWNNIQVSNATISPNDIKSFTARNSINIKSEFIASRGSEVHIYTSEVFSECNGIPFKIRKNNEFVQAINNNYESQKYININFMNEHNKNFVLYPNPCKDECILTINKRINSLIFAYLFDDLGRIIKTYNSIDENTTINLSGISPGFYILKVSYNNTYETIYLIHE